VKRMVNILIDRGDLAEAGGCWCRISPGRIYATYHPKAPAGISACGVCDRMVLRGMGWWWQTPPDLWPDDSDLQETYPGSGIYE
jgi:hypothetical protein